MTTHLDLRLDLRIEPVEPVEPTCAATGSLVSECTCGDVAEFTTCARCQAEQAARARIADAAHVSCERCQAQMRRDEVVTLPARDERSVVVHGAEQRLCFACWEDVAE